MPILGPLGPGREDFLGTLGAFPATPPLNEWRISHNSPGKSRYPLPLQGTYASSRSYAKDSPKERDTCLVVRQPERRHPLIFDP